MKDSPSAREFVPSQALPVELCHEFEVIIRDGRAACVITPTEIPKDKMEVVYALLPWGSKLQITHARQWGVWAAIMTADYRPTVSRPHGHIVRIP